ncbi:TPA: DNA repair protein RadC [Escherichia coli]|jgi:DNA repair protein RadC|uniref:RadC family protein n=1 Tax=Escherichia coli TaxID=562 RepID=UPI0010CBF69F|nr:DNA repair protein RadC [Escherichia coli]EFN7940772.1 DNA repair protein RadC [Escherichia coli]EIM9279431.1 DNA repair protein RadC [Escherichia coli]EJR6306652.1 DNA repair protein RadC [Escherichia coli]QLX77681.1 DNA repair protein RadC [Escherichia coli]GCX85816.1 DNA repair protein [Escherichia coli]
MHDIINQARELLTARLYRNESLGSPKETESYLALQLGDREQEVFAVIFLDNRNQVLQYKEMFYGSIASTSVYPREIARLALRLNAAAVICSHNHPSGHPEPSAADRKITERIKNSMELIDVRVLDHVIVGGGRTVSFAERGWL